MNERRNAWMLKVAVVALSAGLLSACQTSPYSNGQADPTINGPHPRFPIKAPVDQPPPTPPEATAPIVHEPPPPPPAPSTSSDPITSQTLAPLESAPAAQAAPPPSASLPSAPQSSAAPQYKTVTAGAVVGADGPPNIYVVKPGDHLDAIGRELGMSRKELLDLNDIKDANKLKPGQKLKGPAIKGKAYVVGPGDTLSAIGRRFSVTTGQLADENDIKTSDALHPGQKVLLPKGYRDNGPTQVLMAAGEAAPPPISASASPAGLRPPPSSPLPTTPAPSAPVPQVAAATTPSTPNPAAIAAAPGAPCVSAQQMPKSPPAGFPSAAELKRLGESRFVWPVRGGRVLACYGPQPTRAIGLDQKAGVGVINNGIDISANPNTAVRASAGGEIIHAEQVTGSGLTVLIQHPDGWITIYGNLSSLSVPRRDVATPPVDANGKPVPRTKVRAGEEIGRSGGTADGQAMVHFEVRYSKDGTPQPIDPQLVLPPR